MTVIIVWGGISSRGKSELWINYNRERVNSSFYGNIIEEFCDPLCKQRIEEEENPP